MVGTGKSYLIMYLKKLLGDDCLHVAAPTGGLAYWRASETLSGVTQLKIRDVCIFNVCTYICQFVL